MGMSIDLVFMHTIQMLEDKVDLVQVDRLRC